MNKQDKIVILGCGRLGRQLALAYAQKDNAPVQLYNRGKARGRSVSKETNIPVCHQIQDVRQDADVYLLCVSDRAIGNIAQKIQHHVGKGIIAHTSGSFNSEKSSITICRFYPLDSYSDEVQTDFSSVPIILTTFNQSEERTLEKLARILSNQVFLVPEDKMPHLHLAAVFVNNFTNHIIARAQKMLADNKIDRTILHRLMTTTFNNVIEGNANDYQTGPAKRGDIPTLERHLELLQNDERNAELYRLLSELINPDLQSYFDEN